MSIITWLRQFKESTMQQVFAILIVGMIALSIAFLKVPALQVYTYSWKLGWDQAFEPVEVLDDLMALKLPSSLEVLIHNLRDDRIIPDPEIEKREVFFDEGRSTVGDYCLFLLRNHTVMFEDLDYHDGDQYSWAETYKEIRGWYQDTKDHLVWDAELKRFVDKREDVKE